MGQILVIKNVDFSKNKLATISFESIVKCTGITLNANAATMTHLGSITQIIATVSPQNTTDTIIWSSSDISVATVSNGFIKQEGIGTAIITATCGDYSAQCTVTATNILTQTVMKNAIMQSGSTGYDYCYLKYHSDVYYGAGYALQPSTKYWCDNDNVSSCPHDHVYPILLGNNATTITIEAPENIKVTHIQLNCNEMCNRGIEYPYYKNIHYAKKIINDANAYDSNVSPGDRIITVAEGANSVVFSFRGQDHTLSDQQLSQIKITVT